MPAKTTNTTSIMKQPGSMARRPGLRFLLDKGTEKQEEKEQPTVEQGEETQQLLRDLIEAAEAPYTNEKTPYGNIQETTTTINYEVASVASPTAQPPTPMRLQLNTETFDSPPVNIQDDHVYVKGNFMVTFTIHVDTRN
jgi:hypothetical protein